MDRTAAQHIHHLPAAELAGLLEVDVARGLGGEEARRRLKLHGFNRLTPRERMAPWRRFALQFHQPLVYILLGATGVTFYLAEYVDAGVIFAVVLVNAIVGYLQEAKAEKAIEALARLVVTESTVRRDGRKQRVPSEELVPGDVVLLQAGDRVPADLRLFRVKNLQTDESALTGESVPVAKHANPLALDTILAERRNQAYAGTLVTAGTAEGVVWATGDRTETGRIATLIAEAVELSTPLTRKIAQFSRLLLWVILGLAAVTFFIGVSRGEDRVEMFMAAVALAVGAIPEGLPAAVTITLALGVARMARRRAIIRKLPAVETLGSTTVICSDKTGTLTENQMTVQRVWAGGLAYEVTGGGYEPRGEFRCGGHPVAAVEQPALAECLRAGLYCNDAQLGRESGRLVVQGDPTEAALIVAAQKAGLATAGTAPARVDMIPFESEHMFRATLHDHPDGARMIYKVGAVERLLERCHDQLDDAGRSVPLDRDAVRREAEAMAAEGLRVLGFARRAVAADQDRLEHEHVAAGLTFLGLQGLLDPPRADAVTAVARCQEAGIRVKMITGDHALTARVIATRIGLKEADGAAPRAAVTGKELEKLSDAELEETAERTAVFARIAPEQKFRLVQALQARGHVVAMTGDGVNDAPALKQADIGIAMGITGTEVAKGATDMLLTDDNFATIEAAVEEGRGVFDNLTKFIVWTLPTNGGEALLILTAIFLGVALPALPVQLLWVNMSTAIFLGLMLVFEPKEPGLMRRPPRDPRRPLLTYPLLMRTGLVSLLMLVGGFALFHLEQAIAGASLAEARTIVVNTVVIVESFYLLNCRSLACPPWTVGFFSNRWIFAGIGGMLLAQLAFTYLPVMHRLFHTAPVGLEAWFHSLLVGLAVFALVEFEKWARHRRGPLAAADS